MEGSAIPETWDSVFGNNVVETKIEVDSVVEEQNYLDPLGDESVVS